MKLLYVDCFSGVSGDMTLGALIDLGARLGDIEAELQKLGVGGFSLHVSPAAVQGIHGTRLKVEVSGVDEALTEGSVVSLGQLKSGAIKTFRTTQQASLMKAQASGDHQHRPYRDIKALIEAAPLAPRVKARSQAVFLRLAQAEAAVHGTSAEDIAFHEVGSTDAIVDVVGVCIALELLGVDLIHCAPLPMARGFVQCAHGRMPLPAPAVANLIKGVPVVPDSREGEWVTPTGAAIVTALASAFGDLPAMTPDAVGYGLGSRDGGPIPNALRLILGEVPEPATVAPLTVVEANIDDMTPQLAGHALSSLLEAGARDAWITPIQMKKGRPAVQLSALCDASQRETIIALMLRETTSIGVRHYDVRRRCLSREIQALPTPWGLIRVKISGGDGPWPTVTPEYDDCVRVAAAAGIPVRRVQQEAVAVAAQRGLLNGPIPLTQEER